MGVLPAVHVTPAPAFATCDVDYAGTFLVVDCGRYRTSRKAYLCLFVCFVTKTVHLELATDLTIESILKCLRRFISRRGRCRAVYSDNGTNFIGAQNELRALSSLLASRVHNDRIIGALAQEQIEWHLIPSHAQRRKNTWATLTSRNHNYGH
ncbi:uncharacterized protein LOC143146252 [Ptiloglossa arizonensis]|uniref:uncharacterized protein LOC143146252 n=1 Tax=Ptiloglossa arizonensis TaxID=3350558 RepID=UPI003F9F4180